LSKVALEQINNENWTPLKKLWRKLKMIRSLWKVETNEERKDYLKEWEKEIAEKIVKLSKTVTDGKGNRITIPFFAILGSNQDGK
jgi:predicted Holliday junction resolvase-like endonuclease